MKIKLFSKKNGHKADKFLAALIAQGYRFDENYDLFVISSGGKAIFDENRKPIGSDLDFDGRPMCAIAYFEYARAINVTVYTGTFKLPKN